jgi:hypothetical protein
MGARLSRLARHLADARKARLGAACRPKTTEMVGGVPADTGSGQSRRRMAVAVSLGGTFLNVAQTPGTADLTQNE